MGKVVYAGTFPPRFSSRRSISGRTMDFKSEDTDRCSLSAWRLMRAAFPSERCIPTVVLSESLDFGISLRTLSVLKCNAFNVTENQ